MIVSIRPNRRRHRRPLILAAVVTLVLLCCTGASVNGQVRTGYVAVAVALSVLPLLGLIVLTSLNVRNVALHLYADGRLESVAWTGRRTTVEHPDAVRLQTLWVTSGRGKYVWDRDQLLVVSGPGSNEPIVVVPRWWRKADLDRLTTTLHIPITEPDPVTFGEFAHQYEGSRLPLSLRHPWTVSLSLVAAGMAGVFLLLYLLTHLSSSSPL